VSSFLLDKYTLGRRKSQKDKPTVDIKKLHMKEKKKEREKEKKNLLIHKCLFKKRKKEKYSTWYIHAT
jgi:hypothetical protein